MTAFIRTYEKKVSIRTMGVPKPTGSVKRTPLHNQLRASRLNKAVDAFHDQEDAVDLARATVSLQRFVDSW